MKFKIKSEFYRTFLMIGIPLMIQQLVSSSLNFIDNLMIGRLGTDYIAAVGFANNVYRVYDLCLFGLYSGMGIFIAQYYGKRDFKVIKQILGTMIRVGIVIGLIFSSGAYLFSEKIIGIYTKDPEVLRIGVSYLKRAVFCYNFYSLTFAIGYTFRGIGLTRVPMLASACGVITNTCFNYLLIYGNYGFPRMEERGAATATIMARAVELTILLSIVFIKGYNIKGKFSEYFKLPKILLREIVKRTIPVFFTELLWILGVLALTVAYSRLGTVASASVQISAVVDAFGAIIFMGISNASAIIIGHTIGQGNMRRAKLYSQKLLKMAVILALSVGILIQIFTPLIIGSYKLQDLETINLALTTMRIIGMFVSFKMINWVILIGLFRAGGDTKVAFLIDTGPLWCFAVPMAFIGAYLGWPLYKVLLIVECGDVIKFILGAMRYRSMKWIRDVTI